MMTSKNINKFTWFLSSDTKEIAGMICYKATCTETITNPNGIFSYPITVWYSPNIPFSSGPLEYSGVPGLILELNRGNVTYGAIKIEYNVTDFFLPNYDFSKAITEKDLIRMRQDFLNSTD